MSNRVLIVTDDVADANALQATLPQAVDGPFEIDWVRCLQQALARLEGDGIDIALMDFSLPDSEGIDTFDRLFAAAPAMPILSLVAEDKIELARQAVQRGAQGYLLKGHFHNALVPQALRNIIQRKQVEEALFVEKERAQVTLNSIGDGVISTDRDSCVTYINHAAARMAGWSMAEAIGQPVAEVLRLIDRNSGQVIGNPVARVIHENRPQSLSANSLLLQRNGQTTAIEDSTAPIYDRRGRVTGAVIVFRDIGPAQALMIQKLTYLAQHDPLTDLPNRTLLHDRLTHAIALAKRTGTSLAVLFLDLDNFKHINDSLGHAIGDKLLQSVAQRLLHCTRASDTVSRHGGDEFVILAEEDRHAEDIWHTADKVIAALSLPHFIESYEFHTTASIGISLYPADGEDAETLIKNADTAMYHAKDRGRNNFQFFNAEMNRRAVERQAVEADLRLALERHEFVLHYQPKINLRTGAIAGVEALLRWQHPSWGMVLPERFIQIAEDCGLIVPIGRWVLREACAQTKRWQASGLPALSVAVNVSVLEFRHRDFIEGLRATLSETGLAPSCLQLEITESLLMRDAQSSIAILRQVKEMGVQLAVDDFGTGYSSLSYLKQFPIDVLKIDQSFVQGIGSVKDDSIIVSAVIGMGTSLQQRVVAEGVEDAMQLEFLQAQHCEEGQGYLFSRPLGAEQCADLLVTGITQKFAGIHA